MIYLLFLLISPFLYGQNYVLKELIYTDKVQSNLDESNQDIIILDDFKNEKTLEDVLRNIPGVLIKRSSGVSSFNYRGLPSKYSLILLNGKRVVDLSGIDDGFNLDSIDIAIVDKIEILNGTSALAYGSGSYASVINILTENYNNEVQFNLGAKNRVSLNHATSSESSILYGKLFYEEDKSLSAIQNGDEKDEIQRKGINLGFDKEFNNGSFKIDTYGLKDFREIDGYYNFVLIDLEGIYTKKEISNTVLDFRYKKLKLSSSFYYSNRNTISYISNALVKSNFESKNSIQSIEYNSSGFLFGFENDHQLAITNDKYKRSINSIYLIKDLKISNSFSSSFSFRSELLSESLDNSFAFGTVYKMNSFSKLKFNYSKGFKRPSFYQLYDNQSGNDGLSNENSEILDFSYLYLDSVKVSLFYNNISNQIVYDLTSFRYTNSSFLESRGVEFKYLNSIKDFRYTLGGTLFRTSTNDLREGYFASLSHSFKKWTLSSRFNHVGAKKDVYNDLKSYNLLYLGIEKKLKNISISLNVFNTLNESYQEVDGYETLGRNFELRLKYRF